MRQILLVLSCSLFTIASAQELEFATGPNGYYTGSLIKNGNSVQHFTVEFYPEEDSIKAQFNIPDWVYYGGVNSTVKRKGRVLEFGSFYGDIQVVMDSAYAEMIGECDFARVHMKKGLRPPRIKYEQLDTRFDLGDIKVEGIVTKPIGKGPFPTVIIVHGRGAAGKDVWDKRPEVLSQYGIAVVTFDKRGHERTGYPYELTSMRDHAKDLSRVTQQVQKFNYTDKVGYLAYSAGGWVAPMAANKVEVDFIASIVGPSTSVRQQQLDCSLYFVRDQLGLDQQAVSEAVRYCELEFSDDDPEMIFEEMSSLLDSAEAHGWKAVLEESDIVSSPEGIDSLWVRKNRYDPASDLESYKGPFLAVLGGDDFVVPYRENSDRYLELFENIGKKNYRITVIPSANHGMEHWHKSRDLEYEASIKKWHTYFKFDRVAAGAMDEFISFLREYDFID